MEKRRQNQTFTNGWLKNGSADPDKTVTSTFESSTQAYGRSSVYGNGGSGAGPNNASRSNGFFGASNPNRTASGANRFGDQPLIGDEKDLKSDALELSREELKERLFVAEKVMKTLFKRNKELEEMQTTSGGLSQR